MTRGYFKKGFTFVEVCMSVIILSLIFTVATIVVSHARKETNKGYWMQQSIEYLRNATKLIGIKIKNKNYPSIIIFKHKSGSLNPGEDPYERKIINFKETRTYDRGGRLRQIEVNTNKWYELALKPGTFLPSADNQELMYFPICTPKQDFEGDSKDGGVVWTRFLLEPSKNYNIDQLGQIVMEEYIMPLPPKISSTNPEVRNNFDHMAEGDNFRRKQIITDVSKVEIKNYNLSIEGGKGIGVDKNGNRTSVDLVKNIIVFKITCTNPKDKKLKLSDMCAITTDSEVKGLLE